MRTVRKKLYERRNPETSPRALQSDNRREKKGKSSIFDSLRWEKEAFVHEMHSHSFKDKIK